MSTRKLFVRIANLVTRNRQEERLRAEIDAHIALQTEENIRSGIPRADARRQALLKFGAVEPMKEAYRDQELIPFFENLLRDLKYGLRILCKSPGFTAVAVVTLALGIGANTAIFSLLDAVLLRPLPYAHPDRLFRLYPVDAKHGPMTSTSYPDFQDWKEQSRSFEATAAYDEQDLTLTGTAEPERLRALCTTPGLFAMLGTRPILGHEFGPNGSRYVALLSYGLWQRRFAGDPAIIGKAIYLDGWAYTVLGVLPPRFYFPPEEMQGRLTAEVFVPATANADRGWNYLRVIGRLAPQVTEQQAQSEMNAIAARSAQAYPSAGHGREIQLAALPDVSAGSMRQTAWILFGAAAFVLLIACGNVANLLFAQGAAREHEIAIRMMVGGSRSRIMRQLLTEGLLLATLGGALAVGLTYWTLPLLAYTVPENTMFFTRIHDVGIHLNPTVLAFSALLVALSVVVFGVLPAWRTARPLQSLRATLRASKLRGALITLEITLSLVLLIGAGLMMRSLVMLLDVDVGFVTHELLTLDISLPAKKYDSPEKQAAFFGEVLERFQSLPSVLSVGAVTDLPLTRNDTWNGFEIPGTKPRKGTAGYHMVSPDYFRTMGIPLISGRQIRDSDSARTPLAGVISRSMAQRYWPNRNPVGETIVVYRFSSALTSKGTSIQWTPQQLEIVGVAGDVRQLGLDDQPGPELYMPYAQWPSDNMSVVLRARTDPWPLIPEALKEIWRVDPEQPVTDVKTMDQWVAKESASRRFALELIGAFALIALILAAVGIYGVVSYWARQRTCEIGIRMALGAEPNQVLHLVVAQGLKPALVGLGLGITAGLALTRFLSSLLYGVKPTDAPTFIVVSLLLTVMVLLASYIPARRATKVDPMVALRYE